MHHPIQDRSGRQLPQLFLPNQWHPEYPRAAIAQDDLLTPWRELGLMVDIQQLNNSCGFLMGSADSFEVSHESELFGSEGANVTHKT
jgi:hypothetical protein